MTGSRTNTPSPPARASEISRTDLPDPAQEHHGSDPPWWTAEIDEQWTKVRSDELSRWFSTTTDRRLDPGLVAAAVGFGWGAYHAYTPSTIWGPALEQRLGTDWERSAVAREGPWVVVAKAVRHGWQRASDSSQEG